MIHKKNSSGGYKGKKSPLRGDGNYDDCEFVMVVDTEEQLCSMVKECGIQGVIDSRWNTLHR